MPTSPRRASFLAALIAAFAVAAIPSGALAAQRYVSPTGTGIACTATTPCSLPDAVKLAVVDGDEVIANGGDYPLTSTVEDNANITLRGVPGQPRPRLLFSGPNQGGLRLMHGSLLRNVEIEQAGDAGAVTSSEARLDGVVVKGGGGASDCSVSNLHGIVRNSIVVAEMPICALSSGPTNASVYRNVTAVSTEPGRAAIVVEGTSGNSTVDLKNVIAKGGAGGAGFLIVTDIGSYATVTATHSNFEKWEGGGGNPTYVDGGGNQQTAPTFVNAAAGDYRQAAGSVTVDSGVNEPLNGAFDVDGDVRRIGTTDIGADEFVPAPVASTGPATGISAQSATLIGSITGIGVPTSYRFEYGSTTAYGSATPATNLSLGLGPLAVTAELGGLSPATTYHYRLVASNKAGVGRGADQSFTTAADTPAAPTSTSTSSATPFAGVGLASSRLVLSRRFITLKLSCPAATVGGCSGQTRLSVRRRTGSRRLGLGRARFSMAAGHQAGVRVRVTRAGLRRFEGVRRLRARDVSVAQDGGGASKTTTAAVTVRRARTR